MKDESPEQIRLRISAKRKSLEPEWITQTSPFIVERFFEGLADKAQGRTINWSQMHIALYRTREGELDTSSLDAQLRTLGAALYYPRIVDFNTSQFEVIRMAKNTPWVKGPYGIEEPPAALPIADPATLDLVFIPGVAYGMKGERMGMGRGFYDRFLSRCTQAVRVALAFDFQLLPQLKQKSWDQPVHWVVTESRWAEGPDLETELERLFKK
ncbi:5-formyltetrahydrofolate cyclo-ligase [bacterium]|nr:5-formyltetrahydrofolate cyclo-ligase [bacterium]